MSETLLNEVSELKAFLENRRINYDNFATRAGLTVPQLERILSGKKAIDATLAGQIAKAKSCYPLVKQTLDIQNFVNNLQRNLHIDLKARFARCEKLNMFIIELNGIDSDTMETCVSYSARFEKYYKMAILFVDAKDKKFPRFAWRKLLE